MMEMVRFKIEQSYIDFIEIKGTLYDSKGNVEFKGTFKEG